MSTRTQLALSAVFVAVLWTAAMWWWNRPLDAVPIAMLAVAGALLGLGWYWLYGKWFRWYFKRQD
jgi:hypothetical protein